MSNLEVMIVLASIWSVVAFALAFYAALIVRSHKRSMDYLHKELSDKVSWHQFRLEQSTRREVQGELNALKDHLDLKSVLVESHTKIVKKGVKV